MSLENNKKNLGACACKNLRKTTRVITQFYDKAFVPAKLKAAQHALLSDISARDNITINELSDILLMDQTTVTRNINILKKSGFIEVKTGEDDLRKRYVTLTEKGRNKLTETKPLWVEAQSFIEAAIGKEEYENFLRTLIKIQKLVN